MKGYVGLYAPKHEYASTVHTLYDDTRGLYVGEVFSREGLYRVEAWDQGSLDLQLDYILDKEYQEMQREVNVGKPHAFGHGIGKSVTIKDRHAEQSRHIQSHVTRHQEGGRPVLTFSGGKHHHGNPLGRLVDTFDVASLTFSLLTGNWADALFSLFSMGFQDLFFGGGSIPKIFAVSFGGVLITAPTRALLRKKLQLHKNKRIQIIMHHMRSHAKNRLHASSTERLTGGLAERLRKKRLQARKSWREKVLPAGQDPGWKGRTLTLKHGLVEKRDIARALWAERT